MLIHVAPMEIIKGTVIQNRRLQQTDALWGNQSCSDIFFLGA